MTADALPGDFARSILGQSATPATVEACRTQLGLDRPPVERCLGWAGRVARATLTFPSQAQKASTAAKDRWWASSAPLPAGAIALVTVGVNFVVDWTLHMASRQSAAVASAHASALWTGG